MLRSVLENEDKLIYEAEINQRKLMDMGKRGAIILDKDMKKIVYANRTAFQLILPVTQERVRAIKKRLEGVPMDYENYKLWFYEILSNINLTKVSYDSKANVKTKERMKFFELAEQCGPRVTT